MAYFFAAPFDRVEPRQLSEKCDRIGSRSVAAGISDHFRECDCRHLLMRNRILLRCNRRMEQIFGFGPGELDQQPVRILYPNKEAYERIDKVYANFPRHNQYVHEPQLVRKDGRLIWCIVSGRLLNSREPAEGSIWVVQDILRSTRRRTRLLQRVRAGEGVDRRERISDPGEIENGAVSTEKNFAPAARLARQMSASAVAIAAGGGIFQVRFERGQRGRVPMLAPLMRVGSSSLNSCSRYSRPRGTISGCESQATICATPPHTRAAPGVARQQRRVRMRLVGIFDDRQRARTGSVLRRRPKPGSAIIGLTARYAASRCAPFKRSTSTTSSGTGPLSERDAPR